MRTTFTQAQRNISDIANRASYNKDILFELLAAYGRSQSAITKLRNGINNLAVDKENDFLQRDVVYFKYVPNGKLHSAIEDLEQDPLTVRYYPRYLITTDFEQLIAKDIKKGSTLDIKLRDIDRHVDFFYGWTGDEIANEKTEAVADRRAADKMKELYYEVEKINKSKLAVKGNTFLHDLNVFFTRLLFCFFAEDTKVFSKTEKGIFTNSIKDFTQVDGSDLQQFLESLFNSLDSEDKSSFTSPFSKFPYVNGSIFNISRSITIPTFNAQARELILQCGSLTWAEINPDIFGSMFQGIVSEEYRATHGMHYTSVPNIMKTIEPLFLDELREEFDNNYDDISKLGKLLTRISKIKIFDPACGSGNFLIIAYKELRKLEHGIIERMMESGKLEGLKLTTSIKLDNFYGIEIDDFAHEVAILSLYLAKHQMNIEFEKQFGKEIALIPLKDKANIFLANATRVDWEMICPNKSRPTGESSSEQTKLIEHESEQNMIPSNTKFAQKEWDEIYLISNPPYLGQRNQEEFHKSDLKHVFEPSIQKYKKLDYVCCWFMKGAQYIHSSKAKLAFISTNSICQGVQVEQLWPRIYEKDLEISYAFEPFKWVNSASDVAGVICTVISLRNISNQPKYLFTGFVKTNAANINPYLVDGPNTIVEKTIKSISGLHPMLGGCQPREGGFLMLDTDTKNRLINEDNRVEKYIKKMVGSNELLEGITRWCIWIEDNDLEDAIKIPLLNERIEKVRTHRLNGNSVEKTFARVPHKFVTTKRPKNNQIVIPTVTTGARKYIPISFLGRDIIVNSRAYCLFDAPLEYFALLSSQMHMAWISVVSGRLGNAINYSSHICYNTFPLRQLTKDQQDDLRLRAKEVLFVRENHSERTLAEMYDPDKMPEDLEQAHHELDLTVDQLYRAKPYANDEERLTDLFALYETMTITEKEQK